MCFYRSNGINHILTLTNSFTHIHILYYVWLWPHTQCEVHLRRNSARIPTTYQTYISFSFCIYIFICIQPIHQRNCIIFFSMERNNTPFIPVQHIIPNLIHTHTQVYLSLSNKQIKQLIINNYRTRSAAQWNCDFVHW